METYYDQINKDILAFRLEDAPYPSSTNQWEDLLRELDFDEIAASTAHAKPPKGVSTEHLSKVWCINIYSDQKTVNITTQRGERTDNIKLTRKFGTGDKMLRYNCISKFSLWILSL